MKSTFWMTAQEAEDEIKRRESVPTNHNQDSDCTVDPNTDECTVCGVMHGEPCMDCGGRGFHKSGCFAQ